jgi:hypothetical protein
MSAEPVFVTGGTGYIGRPPPACASSTSRGYAPRAKAARIRSMQAAIGVHKRCAA